MTLLRRAAVLLPSIDGVHEDLRALIVDNNLYELTAENLRTALDITGEVPLDRVRKNDTVYHHCLTMLDDYLDAVENDEATDYSARKPETLIDALTVVAGSDENVERLTATASPDSSLRSLIDAPESAWPALANATLFKASLENLATYRSKIGEIDEGLGRLLIKAGVIHLDDGDSEDCKQAEAIAILNASSHIPSIDDRLRLVESLELTEQIFAVDITPEGSNLFAQLIEHGLVADDATTFTHLREAGWAAMEPALIASENVKDFLTPDMVDGMIAPLCATPVTSSKVGPLVLENLADFLPTDDHEALREAAKLAVRTGTAMPVEQIRRVAVTCKDSDLTVKLLHKATLSATEIMPVLIGLGGKYANLGHWNQTSFEVPYDEAHRAVFKILSEANICKSNKRHSRQLLVVKQP